MIDEKPVSENIIPLLVDCSECQHVWSVAYLPMGCSDLSRILENVVCPKCAADGEFVFGVGQS